MTPPDHSKPGPIDAPQPPPRGPFLRRSFAIAGVLLLACVLCLGFSFASAPLSQTQPLPPQIALPPAAPPAGMALFQLPTGVMHRSAAAAYRGGSPRDRRDFAMTAALVRHPRGDLLIDTGFGRHIDAHFRMMPTLFRVLSDYERTLSAADQLDRAGYDRRSLAAILLTHAHWDHTSGLPDFPGTPVWLPAAERDYIRDGAFSHVARSFVDVQYREYTFPGGSYLGFPRSHDVYGDGAIVIVPAPGHTPGSVIIFVTLPTGARYAFVGDLVWQREGITQREEKPWIVRTFVDLDAAGVRLQLLRMAAIVDRFPDITLVPAHDARGFAGLPTFPPR